MTATRRSPHLSSSSSSSSHTEESVEEKRTAPKSSSSSTSISDYERIRLENIQRNEEYLRSLGINVNIKVQRQEEEKAKKEDLKKKREAAKRKREQAATLVEGEGEGDDGGEIIPIRRSKRISQQPAENETEVAESYWRERPAKSTFVPYELDLNIDDEDDPDYGRVKVTAPMLRELIQASNPEHDELITNDSITHTAYRMSYMSNEKLATRLKAIAR